jgi:hypothetical protein
MFPTGRGGRRRPPPTTPRRRRPPTRRTRRGPPAAGTPARRRRRARLLPAALAAALLLAAGAAPAGAATPTPSPPPPGRIEVTPDWRDLPGKDKILQLLDVASQLGLACCVGSMVVGGAVMGISRFTGQTSGRAPVMVLGGAGGALVIVFAPDLVGWLTA